MSVLKQICLTKEDEYGEHFDCDYRYGVGSMWRRKWDSFDVSRLARRFHDLPTLPITAGLTPLLDVKRVWFVFHDKPAKDRVPVQIWWGSPGDGCCCGGDGYPYLAEVGNSDEGQIRIESEEFDPILKGLRRKVKFSTIYLEVWYE